MSLFGGASRQTKEEKLAMEMHMEGTLKVFNNMSRLCFKKCIPNFHEAELNVAMLLERQEVEIQYQKPASFL